MSEITKPWLPTVDAAAVRRNAEHWPAQVEGFLSAGYGGETQRKKEEERRGGDEHAPPRYCYELSVMWCERIDAHIADYFLLPKGSFIDRAHDTSAKDKVQKGGAA